MALFKKAVAAATGNMSPVGSIGGGGRSGGSVGVPLQFAFVDVETNGLKPGKDRILEIGIVVTDGLGRELGRWLTLVNPGDGNAGRTDIHLIRPEWLVAAPRFADIAGDVAAWLNGRVLVCHNADFDNSFLEAEFERAGNPIAHIGIPLADTMSIANTVGLPRALHKACAELGYRYDSHNAIDDAVACAELFHRLLPMVDRSTFAGIVAKPVEIGAAPSGRTVQRAEASIAVRPRPVLSDFTANLWAHNPYADHAEHDLARYRATVIAALEDGYIDADEQLAMATVAHGLRLSVEDVEQLHHEVILELIDSALEDRRISKAERSAIETAAVWLGVDLSNWDDLVRAARARVKENQRRFAASIAGRTVHFTGKGVHPSNIREALALKHGMSIAKSFGASVDLLVVGREDLESATVNKARSAGVEILAEATLWTRLGET